MGIDNSKSTGSGDSLDTNIISTYAAWTRESGKFLSKCTEKVTGRCTQRRSIMNWSLLYREIVYVIRFCWGDASPFVDSFTPCLPSDSPIVERTLIVWSFLLIVALKYWSRKIWRLSYDVSAFQTFSPYEIHKRMRPQNRTHVTRRWKIASKLVQFYSVWVEMMHRFRGEQ